MSLLFFLGRMFIFYGNKTSTQFLNFTPTVICSDDLQSNILKCSSMCLFLFGFRVLCHTKLIKLLDQGMVSLNMKK